MIDIEATVAAILAQPELLTLSLVEVHFPTFLSDEGHRADYIKQMQQLGSPAIPYEYQPDNPLSIYHTVMVLSNLLDLDAEDSTLAEELTDWLVNRHQQGWWSNPELQQITVPAWHRPDNLTNQIFITALTAGTLARIHLYPVDQVLQQALDRLDTVRSDNGALFGIPQSTWLLTPAVARIRGLTGSAFLQQWSLLDQYVKQNELSTTLTVARMLTAAAVEIEDPLLQRAVRIIKSHYHEGANPGWYINDEFSPRSSLAALLVLKYTNSK